jgi:hypothetical protein
MHTLCMQSRGIGSLVSLTDKTKLGNCTLSSGLTPTLGRATYVYVLYAHVIEACLAHVPAGLSCTKHDNPGVLFFSLERHW